MPRPCECDKPICPLCKRFNNDPRYRMLWGGPPLPKVVKTVKPAARSVESEPVAPPAPGPGTKLKMRIATFGIDPTSRCHCLAIARDMDTGGAEWCLEHIDWIVGQIEDEVTQRGWGVTILKAVATSPMEFIRLAFSGLTLRGVLEKLVRDACSD